MCIQLGNALDNLIPTLMFFWFNFFIETGWPDGPTNNNFYMTDYHKKEKNDCQHLVGALSMKFSSHMHFCSHKAIIFGYSLNIHQHTNGWFFAWKLASSLYINFLGQQRKLMNNLQNIYILSKTFFPWIVIIIGLVFVFGFLS